MKIISRMTCRRALLVLPLYLSAGLPWAAIGQGLTNFMPNLSAEDLNERAINLPEQLPAEKTMVLMPFTQDQQAEVNTWVAGMSLATSSLAWIETPVIDPSNAFVRAMISAGMRRGIPDTRMRERIITVYTDGVALRRAMGLSSDGKSMVAMVLDRSGKVLTQVAGTHTPEKAKLLLAGMTSP